MSSPSEDQVPPALRVLFMGTPDAAVPTLSALAAAGFPIPLVVTRPDRPKGRGKALAASPVKKAAAALSLPIFQPENVNSLDSIDRLRAAEADVLLIVAYGKILKQSVLDVPRNLPLNLHFSLLPEYRGAAPVAAAIAAGRTETGVTIQRVVRKLDAGPLLSAETIAIEPFEKTSSLERRLAVIGADLAVRTLISIGSGSAEETLQDEAKATFAPMLAKTDGDLDFARDAVVLSNHVRAMDPWPGAQAVFSGTARGKTMPVALTETRPDEAGEVAGDPGEVVAVTKEAIHVATGRGVLRILGLKPAGKKEQSAAAFVNGYAVQAGDRFHSPDRSS